MIGLGYAGLTVAMTLADVGFTVYGVDQNSDIVKSLHQGRAHFFENGLDALVSKYVHTRFFPDTKLPDGRADTYIICVGTPINDRKRPFMGHIKDASTNVGKKLKKGNMVIVRSTIPVGTCRYIVLPALEKTSKLKAGKDFDLIFASERTVEGKALGELRVLPQIIGSLTKEGALRAGALFRNVTEKVIYVQNLESAEMTKLINNTFRDVSFAYANEIALLCDSYGLDPIEIVEAANQDYPRNPVPYPSPGVGGLCLSKDPYILVHSAKKIRTPATLVQHARRINTMIPHYIVKKIMRYFQKMDKPIGTSKIYMMGFAFKGFPETSDMRDSTTLPILEGLRPYAKTIVGFDPVVPEPDITRLGIEYAKPQEGFRNADCIMILNNHPSYRSLPIVSLLKRTRKPTIFYDAWHLFDPRKISQIAGILYGGMGYV